MDCLIILAGIGIGIFVFISGFLTGFRFRRNIDEKGTIVGKPRLLTPTVKDQKDEFELEETSYGL